MAAADQNHPLAIVADTSITAFTLWWFVFLEKSVVRRGSESSDTPPSPGAQ